MDRGGATAARTPAALPVDVELEVPASAAGRDAPWDQLQTFTRLDGPTQIASSADVTIDALRRGAVTLTRMLARAREGFACHCGSATSGPVESGLAGEPFLTVLLRMIRNLPGSIEYLRDHAA